MNFNIEVKTSIGGIIDIIDRSKHFGNYIPETDSSFSPINYKYSQCVGVELLTKVEYSDQEKEQEEETKR